MLSRSIVVLALLLGVIFCDDAQPTLDVPFEPTHPEVVQIMLDLAGVTAQDTVYDLGCGDGRIVVAAAARYGARGVGIDIDPQRIADARENANLAGVANLVRFQKGDIEQFDISKASVVTLYLLNSINKKIRPKLIRELRPGTRIVSHAFHMDDWRHDKKIKHVKARNDVIYSWVVPAPTAGTWMWAEETPAGEVTASLELRQYFQELKGSFTPSEPRMKCRLSGSLEGSRLTVTASVPRRGTRTDVIFEGTVAGDSIVGTQTWKHRAGPVTRPWRAARKPAALQGAWKLSTLLRKNRPDGVLTLSANPGTMKAVLFREGEQASRAATAVYLWGASIRFEIPWGEKEVAVFTGFFDGEEGRGTVHGGPFAHRTSWSAKRVSHR